MWKHGSGATLAMATILITTFSRQPAAQTVIGADLAVGVDMVAGLSLGYSDINASNGSTGQDG